MLIMNLTEEENLTGDSLLIDTVLPGTSLLLCIEFEEVGFITAENAGQCMKPFQNTANKKSYQNAIIWWTINMSWAK